jgi:hypothetical protein
VCLMLLLLAICYLSNPHHASRPSYERNQHIAFLV